jgi:cation:H+ antiporter
MTGTVTRPLALLPILLYVLYLFLQHQEVRDQRPRAAPPGIRPGREWAVLGAGLLLILGGVEALLRAAIALGDYFGTPSFLWGLTVLAAATSLPDLFVSLRAARRGEGNVSLANVIGSNIFDLLVAIPVGVLIAGAASVRYDVAAPMMGVLTLATVALFTMLRTGLALTRAECGVLLGLYGLFVAWMILETAGLTSLVG